MENTEKVINAEVDNKPFILKKPAIKPSSSQSQSVWVTKWVDYSSKYGLGYTLSNSGVGVFFNDQSKILLNANGHDFHYMEAIPNEKYDS